jgi:hypothetical protein
MIGGNTSKSDLSNLFRPPRVYFSFPPSFQSTSGSSDRGDGSATNNELLRVSTATRSPIIPPHFCFRAQEGTDQPIRLVTDVQFTPALAGAKSWRQPRSVVLLVLFGGVAVAGQGKSQPYA